MVHTPSTRETTVLGKRSAPSDTEPYRLSRSMTAEDPQTRHLLLDTLELPTLPASTRRRVNPESLAVRLGPELVAELESFVKPGIVEMPSFAIRQEIQARYNVDRRHIYDWFHSKGLRVTKEDKRATVELKTDAMRLNRRVVRRRVVPGPPLAKARPRPRKLMPEPELQPEPVLVAPISPVLPPVVLPLAKTVDEDVPRPRPWTSIPASQVIGQVSSTMQVQRPPPGNSRTFSDPQIDTVIPLYGDVELDQSQRLTYYGTLSRVLGPAAGVQECIGTYGAYMAKQTEIYYEQLLPGDFAAVTVPTSTTYPLEDLGNNSPSPAELHSQFPTTIYDSLSDSSLDFVNLATSYGDSSSCQRDDSFTHTLSQQESCLQLEDILASPVMHDRTHTLPDRTPLQLPSRAHPDHKTVTFAPTNRALLNFSALLLSAGSGTVAAHSSSSLAGALEEIVPPSPRTAKLEQETRRRSREWSRSRMGRPRAYSAGGGM
ncbi:hypothetical protein L226DRAFT_564747 [Lentinus tigrinus ALCF2SS1-7]|uniref:uncharacterized protein n=1 Tax=Lentinus tigrinus ALCF2SS1-7 TaxID=1328758 RepID=UPI00116608F7|nr:hypothetical protein L226DRAFT_564747 [Lentinus tigrinus ALCF2SS1-7]